MLTVFVVLFNSSENQGNVIIAFANMSAETLLDHGNRKRKEECDPRPLSSLFSVVMAGIFLFHPAVHIFYRFKLF